MALSDFTLQHSLRVRWAEVDPQGIVFNPHYLAFFDVAVTEYWRAIGVPYPEGFAAEQLDTVVAKATLEYRAPARFDDELVLGVRCARIGKSSLRMLGLVTRGEQTLTEIEVIYVCVSGPPFASIPVPQRLIARIVAYERMAPER